MYSKDISIGYDEFSLGKSSKGIKQKLKEIEEKLVNEIKSLKANFELYKNIPQQTVCINEDKFEILREEMFSSLETFKEEVNTKIEKQKRDFLALQEEFRKVKNDSQSLQHTFLIMQRRLQVLEEELGE